jgi:hypothetical protein
MCKLLMSSWTSFSTDNFTLNCINFSNQNSTTIEIRHPKCNKDGKSDLIDILKIENKNFSHSHASCSWRVANQKM